MKVPRRTKRKTITVALDLTEKDGALSLKLAEDKLVGTWSAGDDGGPVDVKKAAAQQEAPKGKS
jgi:hypothetical protein